MFPSLDQARENRPGETRPEYHQEASSQEKKKKDQVRSHYSPLRGWCISQDCFTNSTWRLSDEDFALSSSILASMAVMRRSRSSSLSERGRIPREMRASKTKIVDATPPKTMASPPKNCRGSTIGRIMEYHSSRRMPIGRSQVVPFEVDAAHHASSG